jgi:seryl-tRNA synthetase
MLDIRRIRNDADAVKAALARRRIDTAVIDEVADLDRQARDVAARRDERRAEVKELSRDVGAARRDGDTAKAEELAARSRALGEEEHDLAEQASTLEAEVRARLLVIPNLPAPECPDGASDEENPTLRVEGYDPDGYGEHQRVPHWEVGAALGILDLERGAKLSGSMFPMIRGLGATMIRALCQLALDRNADAYEEIRPPTLVRTETMVSTGHLPKFDDEAYHVERDDLWAIPTAEVPLTSLSRDELLDEADLPRRFMAYTPCYRREAGSAGRDTRGLLRVHEFDKVELLAYATPEGAAVELQQILDRAEGLLQALGLPYRLLEICTGDLGQSHARSFDFEVYAPGCDQWLEVSSVSWYSDYQARRANIRYRPSGQKGTEIIHTLNGSAMATPRVWAAIVETYRQPDGSVRIPDALRPYMRGAEVIPAP